MADGGHFETVKSPCLCNRLKTANRFALCLMFCAMRAAIADWRTEELTSMQQQQQLVKCCGGRHNSWLAAWELLATLAHCLQTGIRYDTIRDAILTCAVPLFTKQRNW